MTGARNITRTIADSSGLPSQRCSTGTQLLQKTWDLEEVVAVVRVAHDDVGPARRVDRTHQRGAVAPFVDVHHTRPHPLGDPGRAVAAAVIPDDHLAFDSLLGEHALHLANAGLEGVRLVEARHHDRQLYRARG